MKALLLIPVLSLPLLFTGCETVVVDRHPAHYNRYVEHDSRPYHRPYRRGAVVVESRPSYYRSEPSYHRSGVTVVRSQPSYRQSYYEPRSTVRYYNDSRGRYYHSGSRRVYVNAGVHY